MTTVHIDKWIPGVTPGAPTSEVALRTLTAWLGAVQYYLPLAAEKSEENSDYVLKLRVWTRRATAALRLYGDLLPGKKSAWLLKELKGLRRAAGEARDYDVMAGKMAREGFHPNAGKWLKKIRKHRAKVQKPLLKRYERLMKGDRFNRRIETLLRHAKWHAGHVLVDPRFGDWARGKLYPSLDRFFGAAPREPMSLRALHDFRLRTKDLRYTMELLAGAFVPEQHQKLYLAIENLQDRLGEISDLATEQKRLRQRFSKVKKTPKAVHLEKLLADEHKHLEHLRAEFTILCTPEFLQQLRRQFDEMIDPTHGAMGYQRLHIV